ncbi:MAG: DoxX family protein [Ilumatobacteraceae bacterium]
MKIVGRIAQTVAALWILDVWFHRFNKDTGYRGGGATNMQEEFAEYGLSKNVMYAVGGVKVSLATMMLVGHAVPKLVRPASAGLAMFMLGAVGMHMKVHDPIKRAMPAITVLTLSTVAAGLADRAN